MLRIVLQVELGHRLLKLFVFDASLLIKMLVGFLFDGLHRGHMDILFLFARRSLGFELCCKQFLHCGELDIQRHLVHQESLFSREGLGGGVLRCLRFHLLFELKKFDIMNNL